MFLTLEHVEQHVSNLTLQHVNNILLQDVVNAARCFWRSNMLSKKFLTLQRIEQYDFNAATCQETDYRTKFLMLQHVEQYAFKCCSMFLTLKHVSNILLQDVFNAATFF